MIDNFDLVKKQLRELSSVINEFKSEAVQIRVVELPFQKMGLETENIEDKGSEKVVKKKGKKEAKKVDKGKEKKSRPKRAAKGGRPGPGTIINQLIEKDFFNKSRSVKDIIDHCQSKIGYTYKTGELSVGLIRAIRNDLLKREKNDKNQ